MSAESRAGLARLNWRILLSEPAGGAENMGCDMALMERARSTGEAVVRVYSWSSPTLSFGRNQKTAGAYDRDAVARAGLAAVRRPTGGRAILHHREITYSVTAPARQRSIAEEYSWINALLVRALGTLGVAAEVALRSTRAPAPDGNPCFAAAGAGEITLCGRKLVGSAQYRDSGALLQHGSVLVADDQHALGALTTGPAPPAPATLQAALGRSPAPVELLDALAGALEGTGIAPSPLAADELAESAARHAAAFRDPDWTWRR